jgi:RNA polymerase-binding transcription factor DksA
MDPEAPAPEAVVTEPSQVASLDAVDADLRAVEAALERIDAGSYGRCEVCGTDLDPAELVAAPLTRACSHH